MRDRDDGNRKVIVERVAEAVRKMHEDARRLLLAMRASPLWIRVRAQLVRAGARIEAYPWHETRLAQWWHSPRALALRREGADRVHRIGQAARKSSEAAMHRLRTYPWHQTRLAQWWRSPKVRALRREGADRARRTAHEARKTGEAALQWLRTYPWHETRLARWWNSPETRACRTRAKDRVRDAARKVGLSLDRMRLFLRTDPRLAPVRRLLDSLGARLFDDASDLVPDDRAVYGNDLDAVLGNPAGARRWRYVAGETVEFVPPLLSRRGHWIGMVAASVLLLIIVICRYELLPVFLGWPLYALHDALWLPFRGRFWDPVQPEAAIVLVFIVSGLGIAIPGRTRIALWHEAMLDRAFDTPWSRTLLHRAGRGIAGRGRAMGFARAVAGYRLTRRVEEALGGDWEARARVRDDLEDVAALSHGRLEQGDEVATERFLDLALLASTVDSSSGHPVHALPDMPGMERFPNALALLEATRDGETPVPAISPSSDTEASESFAASLTLARAVRCDDRSIALEWMEDAMRRAYDADLALPRGEAVETFFRHGDTIPKALFVRNRVPWTMADPQGLWGETLSGERSA